MTNHKESIDLVKRIFKLQSFFSNEEIIKGLEAWDEVAKNTDISVLVSLMEMAISITYLKKEEIK
jgi:hypothetical protein